MAGHDQAMKQALRPAGIQGKLVLPVDVGVDGGSTPLVRDDVRKKPGLVAPGQARTAGQRRDETLKILMLNSGSEL